MMWQKEAADRLFHQMTFDGGDDEVGHRITAFGGVALGHGVMLEARDWDNENAAAIHDAQAAAFLIGWAVALLGCDDEAEYNNTMTRLMDVLSDPSTAETVTEPSPLPTGKVPTGEPIEASSKNPPEATERVVGVDMASGESHTVKQPMRRVPAVSGAEETWEPDHPSIHYERDASRDEVQTGEGQVENE